MAQTGQSVGKKQTNKRLGDKKKKNLKFKYASRYSRKSIRVSVKRSERSRSSKRRISKDVLTRKLRIYV